MLLLCGPGEVVGIQYCIERLYHGVYWTHHEHYSETKWFDKKATYDELEIKTGFIDGVQIWMGV